MFAAVCDLPVGSEQGDPWNTAQEKKHTGPPNIIATCQYSKNRTHQVIRSNTTPSSHLFTKRLNQAQTQLKVKVERK